MSETRSEKLVQLWKNAISRPHVSIVLAFVFTILAIDAILSWFKGDFLWFLDYWYNWYVQEAWYVISTPSIWGEAAKFYLALAGSILLAIMVPLIIVAIIAYNLVWKSLFKKWYLNGYEEGIIMGWIHPRGFWYKAYVIGAEVIASFYGERFEPPKASDTVDFLYSPNWRVTIFSFFNPLGGLKRYSGSESAKIVGKTSSTVMVKAKNSLVAKSMLRKVYTDTDELNIKYAKGEIDLQNTLRKTQSICGKAIGDALYSNPKVHKDVLDDQGFIIPESYKERIFNILMRRKA